MPFYEYECASCKFYSEVMQKISDAPLTKCPSCGKNTLKKLVSAPNFRLKGSGWYETDFKSDSEGKRNLADREEKPAESADAKGTDAKAADAKPAEASAGEAKVSAPKADAKPAVTRTRAAAAKSAGRKSAAVRRPVKAKAKAKAKAKPARKARR